jgi:hypothetical protein
MECQIVENGMGGSKTLEWGCVQQNAGLLIVDKGMGDG